MTIEQHGGNIYKASDAFGIEKDEILDYSANINPLGIPKILKDIFISNIKSIGNYPEPECTLLKNAISSYTGVNSENIIIGNGATEVISLLFGVLLPKRILIPIPTFSEYQKHAEINACKIEFFILKEQENFRLDMKDLIQSLTDSFDAVILCNPNNPTSTLIKKEDLEELIRFAALKNITVIIDEAFIELTDGGNRNSVSNLLMNYDNLFIIRSFTKVFAIPGIRLGYGLGNSKLIHKMWEKKISWSVNNFACMLAEFLPRSDSYIDETRQWLLSEKEYFYLKLCEIKDLKVYKPETNFILIKLLDSWPSSYELRHQMGIRGILIRDASNFATLDKRYVRVAIKDRKSNTRFLEVISSIINQEEQHGDFK